VTSYVLFIGCYRDFGQREHLAFAYSLPYILLAVGRLEGRRAPPGIALVAGLAAGVGFALKPYFLAVPLLVELLAALWRRSRRFVFRLEVWALAGVISVYLLTVLIATPAYVFEVVPSIRPVYWGFNNDLGTVLSPISSTLVGFALSILLTLLRKGEDRALQWCLIAAAGGFLLAYLVQMKGYSYHGLPFRSLVLVSLGLHLYWTIARSRGAGPVARLGPAALAGAAFLAVIGSNALDLTQWHKLANRDGGSKAAQIDEVIALVPRIPFRAFRRRPTPRPNGRAGPTAPCSSPRSPSFVRRGTPARRTFCASPRTRPGSSCCMTWRPSRT
jgi:hypothetical protein